MHAEYLVDVYDGGTLNVNSGSLVAENEAGIGVRDGGEIVVDTSGTIFGNSQGVDISIITNQSYYNFNAT